jgi:hypothetical protein
LLTAFNKKGPSVIKGVRYLPFSEEILAKEIARIANQAMALGYKLEDENRLLTKEEAYQQVSHSASLFKAILQYVSLQDKSKR